MYAPLTYSNKYIRIHEYSNRWRNDMFGLTVSIDSLTIAGMVTIAVYLAMFAVCFFSKRCSNYCWHSI